MSVSFSISSCKTLQACHACLHIAVSTTYRPRRKYMKIDQGLCCKWRSLIIINTFCALLPFQAIGAEWKLFFENQTRMTYYIDMNSIVSLPTGKMRAWEKIENTRGEGNLALLEVDCRERKYTFRAMEPINKMDIEFRKALNANMRNWTVPDQEWEYLGTSDYDEAVFNTWCSSDNTTKRKGGR